MPSRRKRGPGKRGLPADFPHWGGAYPPWVKPIFQESSSSSSAASSSSSGGGKASRRKATSSKGKTHKKDKKHDRKEKKDKKDKKTDKKKPDDSSDSEVSVIPQHWVHMGPAFSNSGQTAQARKNCLSRSAKVRHLMSFDDAKFCPSSLSNLGEKEIEQVYFIATGLSPLLHVKDLIRSKKDDLQKRAGECYQRLQAKTEGARVGQLNDDWSNIDSYAAQLGWYSLFQKKNQDKNKNGPDQQAQPEESDLSKLKYASERGPRGELAVIHKHRNLKLVVGCPGAPISSIYRQGQHMLKIAETPRTAEYVCKLDTLFDCTTGLESWWANVADVAVQLMDEAVWARNYIDETIRLDPEHWQSKQIQNLMAQKPDPGKLVSTTAVPTSRPAGGSDTTSDKATKTSLGTTLVLGQSDTGSPAVTVEVDSQESATSRAPMVEVVEDDVRAHFADAELLEAKRRRLAAKETAKGKQ